MGAGKPQDINLQCHTVGSLLPLWSSDRKTPLNLMSLSFYVMGRRSRLAFILQKAITTFRWMPSEGPRCVSLWPETRKGKPWRLALLFSTTTGLKLSECGSKRLHGAEESLAKF
jgi:hypothetical protein